MRLFLISDKVFRKEIVEFYKDLKETAKKSEGKVGSLADTQESRDEQTTIEKSFQALCGTAKIIREKLEK